MRICCFHLQYESVFIWNSSVCHQCWVIQLVQREAHRPGLFSQEFWSVMNFPSEAANRWCCHTQRPLCAGRGLRRHEGPRKLRRHVSGSQFQIARVCVCGGVWVLTGCIQYGIKLGQASLILLTELGRPKKAQCTRQQWKLKEERGASRIAAKMASKSKEIMNND